MRKRVEPAVAAAAIAAIGTELPLVSCTAAAGEGIVVLLEL